MFEIKMPPKKFEIGFRCFCALDIGASDILVSYIVVLGPFEFGHFALAPEICPESFWPMY
jgi:hypothetical protein